MHKCKTKWDCPSPWSKILHNSSVCNWLYTNSNSFDCI